MTNWKKDNINLGEIKCMITGKNYFAVQISKDTVRLWNLNQEQIFLSLQHFQDAIYQDRFREIE